MRATLPCLLALTLSAGCGIEFGPPRNCAERTAWYPDEDGDGIGEPTAVYIGCEAPEGWVDQVDTGYVGVRTRGATLGWRLARRDSQ